MLNHPSNQVPNNLYLIAPEDLLEHLISFPRIHDAVKTDWGTLKLKAFLEELLSDTRNNTRRGFPSKTAEALLSLSLANILFLEWSGMSFEDDPVSHFAIQKWDLPRNF